MKINRSLPAPKGRAEPPAPLLPSLKPEIWPSPKHINVNPAVFGRPLVDLILRPNAAWMQIRDEPLTATQIFERYVFLLAAIGPLCGSIGFTLTGRLTPLQGFSAFVCSYGLVLLFFFGAVYLAHLCAPAFGGKISLDHAAKLIVYSFMPFFVFLAFFLFPPICFLSLVGVYGIVLFFRGVPILSAVPRSQQLLYIMVNAVTWIFFVEMMRCAVFGGGR